MTKIAEIRKQIDDRSERGMDTKSVSTLGIDLSSKSPKVDESSTHSLSKSVLTPHIESLNRAQIENSNELQRLSKRIVELQRKKNIALAEINSNKTAIAVSTNSKDKKDAICKKIHELTTEANDLKGENMQLEEKIKNKEEILARIQGNKTKAKLKG